MKASETPEFDRICRGSARRRYDNGGVVRMVPNTFPANSTRAYDFDNTSGETFDTVVSRYEDTNCTGSEFASFYVPYGEAVPPTRGNEGV